MDPLAEEQQDIINKWFPEYKIRAEKVERSAGNIISEAFQAEDSLFEAQQMTESSLRVIRRKRSDLPPLILFIYSASFDPNIYYELINKKMSKKRKSVWEQRFRNKAAQVRHAIKLFAFASDVLTQHYTASLMAPEDSEKLPLVWELPQIHLEQEGIHPDATWWMSFMLLCELCESICAYGGFSKRFQDELNYILGHPKLSNKMFWLEENMYIHFPSDPENNIPICDLPIVLERVKNQSC